ncbi:MAG: hypothetical protein FWD94_04000 [Treponema sp.]|nr:hypothetical protein [Treponema sp.]
MSVPIPKRTDSFLLIAACLFASALALGLGRPGTGNGILNPFDDFLLGFRPPVPVFGQILLITGESSVSDEEVFSLLMTLIEFGASELVVEVPVSGSPDGISERIGDLNRLVDTEFRILMGNTENLFRGIRMGLIRPEELQDYVGAVLDLGEAGRRRALDAAEELGRSGMTRMGKAAALFAGATFATDLGGEFALPPGERDTHSGPSDLGRLGIRRIAPFLPVSEYPKNANRHIAFAALRTRFPDSRILWEEGFLPRSGGRVLSNGFGRRETRFPLDDGGNILIEPPRGKAGFRTVALEDILEYARLERELLGLLGDGRDEETYGELRSERIPPLLAEHAGLLMERLLDNPDKELSAAWTVARREYLAGLGEFLADRGRRNQATGRLRETYAEFVRKRENLAELLKASFCVLTPAGPGGEAPNSPSALLANALLTGHGLSESRGLQALLWALLPPVLALGLAFLSGRAAFPVGLLLAGICLAGFSLVFVLTGYRTDPVVPTAAILAGILFLSAARFMVGYRILLRRYRKGSFPGTAD